MMWCKTSWETLIQQIRNNRACLDLALVFPDFQKIDFEDQELVFTKDSTKLLPLHKLFSEDKIETGGILIVFKNTARLTQNSKIKFYADANAANLVYEIHTGKEPKSNLAPIILNYGKVWYQFHQGTKANLPIELQDSSITTLACCVTLIPQIWTSACWLTENLTTALLHNATPARLDSYFKPFIPALGDFLSKSEAPSLIKQLVFILLNRILRKIRYIHNLFPEQQLIDQSLVLSDDPEPLVQAQRLQHFSNLNMDPEFLISIIEEVATLRNNEDSGADTIYSEYNQDGAELICSALLPFKQQKGLLSINTSLLFSSYTLPSWLTALINVGILLNFLRRDGALTSDLLSKLYQSLKLPGSMWNNFYSIADISLNASRTEILDTILKIVKEKKARIVNYKEDILIVRDSAFEQRKERKREKLWEELKEEKERKRMEEEEMESKQREQKDKEEEDRIKKELEEKRKEIEKTEQELMKKEDKISEEEKAKEKGEEDKKKKQKLKRRFKRK